MTPRRGAGPARAAARDAAVHQTSASRCVILSSSVLEPVGTFMTTEFTVGVKVGAKSQCVIVSAEDALIAALKVKHENPDGVINYVRKRNRRGDRRHPGKRVSQI
jgi:hypothetical protein